MTPPPLDEIRTILAVEWETLAAERAEAFEHADMETYQPDHSAAVALTALALLVCAALEGT